MVGIAGIRRRVAMVAVVLLILRVDIPERMVAEQPTHRLVAVLKIPEDIVSNEFRVCEMNRLGVEKEDSFGFRRGDLENPPSAPSIA